LALVGPVKGDVWVWISQAPLPLVGKRDRFMGSGQICETEMRGRVCIKRQTLPRRHGEWWWLNANKI
jgi:hypothetical protein